MNPIRFYLALVLFHAGLVTVAVALARLGWRATRQHQTTRAWLWALARGGAFFGAVAVGLAVQVTLGMLLPAYRPRASQLGSLLVRLLVQALFGEGLLLLAWLAIAHLLWGLRARSALLIGATAALFGVYWRAYHVEPQALRVRRHEARLGKGARDGAADPVPVPAGDLRPRREIRRSPPRIPSREALTSTRSGTSCFK